MPKWFARRSRVYGRIIGREPRSRPMPMGRRAIRFADSRSSQQRGIDDPGLGKFLDTGHALLAPDARLFATAKRNVKRQVQVFVHPHGATVDAASKLDAPLRIGSPYRRAQSVRA